MNKIKILIFAISMGLSITSCEALDDIPLENDPPTGPLTLQQIRSEFANASGSITPLYMGKNEWALYRIKAKLYTGEFQGLGYKAAQALDASNDTIEIEDPDNGSQTYRTRNLNILNTDYKEPVGDAEPEIELQKEWACKFIPYPYYIWYGECSLPPEQNFWLFQALEEPETPIFFSLIRYRKKEKLPQKLIDENRCYDFENCEIDVNYLEYDMIGKDVNGEETRIHYVTSYSGQLPYLASNLKTCYTTLINIDGIKHPAEVCQELVNFQPGDAPPQECHADPSVPCP